MDIYFNRYIFSSNKQKNERAWRLRIKIAIGAAIAILILYVSSWIFLYVTFVFGWYHRLTVSEIEFR